MTFSGEKTLKSSPHKLAYMREYVRRHPKKKRAYNREYYLKTRETALFAQIKRSYGLTRDEWQRLYDTQHGLCRLCGGAGHIGGRSAKLYVDHCHATGKVRGLLCHRCNLGLGALGDNEAGLLKALAYVRGLGV